MREPLRFMSASIGGPAPDVLAAFEQTLQVEFHEGGVEVLRELDTGWRTLPFTMISQNPYGTGRLDLAGARYDVSDHSACCIPAGVRHRCSLISASTLTRWVHARFLVFGGVDLFHLVKPPLFVAGKPGVAIGDLNEEAVRLMCAGVDSLAAAARRKAVGLKLVAALLAGADIGELAAPRAGRLLAAIRHVHDHLHRAITLRELARIAGLSPSRFHALFRARTGVAPRDYIVRTRIGKAQELLIGPPLSMTEIAERVGYADQFHFSRAFKRVCGVAPSRYQAHLKDSVRVLA